MELLLVLFALGVEAVNPMGLKYGLKKGWLLPNGEINNSKNRLSFIKKELKDNRENLSWGLIRQEIKYVEYGIEYDPKFNLTKYLKKNSFIGPFFQRQFHVDRMLDEVLRV